MNDSFNLFSNPFLNVSLNHYWSHTLSLSLNFLLPLIAGLALGTIFFYGLWRTVEKLTTAKSPALWLFGSAILRLAITLSGFYLVAIHSSQNRLANLLLCLLGFVVARFAITKILGVPQRLAAAEKEVQHAS